MTELASVISILFFSLLFCIGSLIIGVVLGWFANEYVDQYFAAKLTYHPEMFDDNGHVLDEKLLSLRFVVDEDEEYFEED